MKLSHFCFILCILLMVSCTKGNEVKTDEMISFTDCQGRTVTLPHPAARTIVLADSALCCISQLDADDAVIALDSKTLKNRAMLMPFKKNPSLAALPDIGKASNANYEEIVKLSADAVFIKSGPEDALAIEQNTGIPVICVKYENGIDFSIYRVIAKALGKEKECEELLAFYQSKLEVLSDFSASIPENEKKSAYVAIANSKAVATRTMVDLQGLNLAGGRNCAAEVSNSNEWGQCDVTKEAILKWNPDIVFIDRSNGSQTVTIEDFSADADFAFLSAVQNGNVFSTFFFFAAPKDYATLIAEGFYNAHILYPDRIGQDESDRAINAILLKAYGISDYKSALYRK